MIQEQIQGLLCQETPADPPVNGPDEGFGPATHTDLVVYAPGEEGEASFPEIMAQHLAPVRAEIGA